MFQKLSVKKNASLVRKILPSKEAMINVKDYLKQARDTDVQRITELFCFLDDFCKAFLPQLEKRLLENGIKKRNRSSRMAYSEMLTILILFHTSGFRTFKAFYGHVGILYGEEFRDRLSYNRFVQRMPQVLLILSSLLHVLSKESEKTGIYFIDSFSIKACHIKREKQNKVMKGIAKKGKTSVGWFYGFKLHTVINNKGEIMSYKFTAGNVDDRVPVEELTKELKGKVIGDKGYIGQDLFERLINEGIELVTKPRKNAKNKLVLLINKLLLKKRGIIESVGNQLKNVCQIEHTRHRSPWNFLVNLFSGIVGYNLKPNKPSIEMAVPGEMLLLA